MEALSGEAAAAAPAERAGRERAREAAALRRSAGPPLALSRRGTREPRSGSGGVGPCPGSGAAELGPVPRGRAAPSCPAGGHSRRSRDPLPRLPAGTGCLRSSRLCRCPAHRQVRPSPPRHGPSPGRGDCPVPAGAAAAEGAAAFPPSWPPLEHSSRPGGLHTPVTLVMPGRFSSALFPALFFPFLTLLQQFGLSTGPFLSAREPFRAPLGRGSAAAAVGRLLPAVPELLAEAPCDGGVGTSLLTVSRGAVVTRYTGSTVRSRVRVGGSQRWAGGDGAADCELCVFSLWSGSGSRGSADF